MITNRVILRKVQLVSRKNKSTYKVDPFALDEITTLLDYCEKNRPAWRPYWQFAFYSGLRTSEQFALKWEKVDWRRNIVLIDEAVVERKLKEVKTRASEAEIYLLPMAREALQDQRALTESFSKTVFVNPRTQKPIIDYEESARCLKYICQRAGIRFRVQRQTRHSFASNLLSGGENPYRVAEMLRHVDTEMIFKVYGKWLEQGSKTIRSFDSEFANVTKRKKHV